MASKIDNSPAAGNLRGACWLLAGAMAMSTQAAIVRFVGSEIHSLQITFLRGLIGLGIVMLFFLKPQQSRFSTSRLKLHLGRAGAGVMSMACGFYAYANMPLAEATALTFTMPLFMTVLAVLVLKEQFDGWRLAATVAGFVGVLIMLRPSGMLMELAAMLALASAVFHATVGILIKKLSATESVANLMLYFALVATVVFFVPAMKVWVQPDSLQWLLFVAIAVLGVTSQLCFIQACRRAQIGVIAPFDYSRLIMAGLLGFILFAEVPDAWSIVGALVIVASAVFIAQRERVLGRRRQLSATAD